jgi:hypothetical protein
MNSTVKHKNTEKEYSSTENNTVTQKTYHDVEE